MDLGVFAEVGTHRVVCFLFFFAFVKFWDTEQ